MASTTYCEYMLRFHLDATCPRPSLPYQRWTALKETVERGTERSRRDLAELWLVELAKPSYASTCGVGYVLEGGEGIGFRGEGRRGPWRVTFSPARPSLRDAHDIVMALYCDGAPGASHGRVFEAAGAAIDAFAVLATTQQTSVTGALELIRGQAARP